MEREYGSLAKQVFGSVLFDWDRKGAIYTARTTNYQQLIFIFPLFLGMIMYANEFKAGKIKN